MNTPSQHRYLNHGLLAAFGDLCGDVLAGQRGLPGLFGFYGGGDDGTSAPRTQQLESQAVSRTLRLILEWTP
ncbi:hypothetical protein [Streptomyces rapamycinicus]|uniref:hypothetical protein n=1 Tax=Streptomyces rapamycinicus TaxID=1226757 RepID=UPI0032D8E791